MYCIAHNVSVVNTSLQSCPRWSKVHILADLLSSVLGGSLRPAPVSGSHHNGLKGEISLCELDWPGLSPSSLPAACFQSPIIGARTLIPDWEQMPAPRGHAGRGEAEGWFLSQGDEALAGSCSHKMYQGKSGKEGHQ